MRNTVARASSAIAFLIAVVTLWSRPGMVASTASMAAVFTLLFVSRMASTAGGKGRWLDRVVWACLMVASFWSLYRVLKPRSATLPKSQSLAIRARVERGPGIPSMAAPELSIAAPGGLRSGFDRASGTIQRALPNTDVRKATSAHSEEDLLFVSASHDGTYTLEVIGTSTGSYDLDVTANDLSRSEVLATTTRTLHDVPMAQGTIHRYGVDYAHERDGMVRLRVVPTSAPTPQPRADRVHEVWRAPGQLSFDLGRGCGDGPPSSARLSTPDGRTAGFAQSATYGQDPPTLRLVEGRIPSRKFILQEAADGEYVLEVSSPERPTSYSLHVAFEAADARYALQQLSINCERTTVARGEVHRWTVRLQKDAEVPLRIAGRAASRAAELP